MKVAMGWLSIKLSLLAIAASILVACSGGGDEGDAVSSAPITPPPATPTVTPEPSATAAPQPTQSPEPSSTPVPSVSPEPTLPPPASPEEGKPLTTAVTQSVVRFVYFVEKGETFNPDLYEALRLHALAMQAYWYEQFDGTFYLYNEIVDVIYGDQEPQWYIETADNIHSSERWYRLGNIKNEVYRKLNIRNFDPQVRVINYPTTRHDGRVGANFGGGWMDGDDLACLIGAAMGYNFPYDDRNPAHCMGHEAHEFGHVFSLDHSGPSDDCMQFGFYIDQNRGEMCSFSQANRDRVKNAAANTAFLVAEPGQVVNEAGEITTR